MKLFLLSASLAGVSAFAPSTSGPAARVAPLYSAPETTEVEITVGTDASESDIAPAEISAFAAADTAAAPSAPASINGWVPDESLPCYGLPGALPPTGYFDPLGFAQPGISLNEVKRNREAEVMHGRVAMIASVGYLAGEAFNGPFGISGPANDQLQQMPAPAFWLLTAAIASLELKRATIGWVEPDFDSLRKFRLFRLRDEYYPGDVGFDPLGFKPKDAKAFANMQTRELQNGRLAMIGVAGMCAQELVNHKTIMGTIDFYQKVYSGINPYEM